MQQELRTAGTRLADGFVDTLGVDFFDPNRFAFG